MTSKANPNYKVFIAYSGTDEDLKNVVVSALSEQMKLTTKRAISNNIFTFKDALAVTDWLERNTQAVAEAPLLVVLLSPNSIYSPWIHYEVGVKKAIEQHALLGTSHGKSKTQATIIIGLAKGLRAGDIPRDIADFYKTFRADFIEIDNRNGVCKFIRSISKTLGTRASCKQTTLASFLRVAKGVGGWRVTSLCAHATPIAHSPFTFMAHIEASTTKHIVDFGQNLDFLFGEKTEAVGRRKVLLKQLRKKDGPTVEIIICDKDYASFMNSWSDLMGSTYNLDLNSATKNLFRFWERYAKYCKTKNKQPRMKVYTVKVMPSSFTFINPKKNGFLFVKPQITGEPTTRPIFCLDGANPYHKDAFNYYWGHLQQLLMKNDFTKKLVLVKGKAVLRPVRKPLGKKNVGH